MCELVRGICIDCAVSIRVACPKVFLSSVALSAVVMLWL
jgi:hypothetical protein